MSSEIYVPNDFSEYAAENVSARSPYVVARQTDFHLKAYFRDFVIDRDVLTSYVSDFTVSMISQAQQAIPLVHFFSKRIGIENFNDLSKHIADEDVPKNMEANLEALSYTSIVFGRMPEDYTSPLYPYGFKNSSSFQPPTTIDQYTDRLNELEKTTKNIAYGKVRRSERPTFRPSLVRTEAFFDVAAKLPPPSTSEQGKFDIIPQSGITLIEGIETELS